MHSNSTENISNTTTRLSQPRGLERQKLENSLEWAIRVQILGMANPRDGEQSIHPDQVVMNYSTVNIRKSESMLKLGDWSAIYEETRKHTLTVH